MRWSGRVEVPQCGHRPVASWLITAGCDVFTVAKLMSQGSIRRASTPRSIGPPCGREGVSV